MRYISKIKIGPKGKLEKLPLGTGMLKKTTDIIKKRQKKRKDLMKKLGM